MISDNITTLNKEVVKTLSKNDLRICHNEYMRRWKLKRRDNWNAIRREHYKKYNKRSDNITKGLIK